MPSPKRAAFIGKIVSDPGSPPRVRMLTGYIGDSNEDGCLRLYSSPELVEYLDIPEASVRHVESVADDALGAARLWVDRDADLVSRGEGLSELRGRFLEGEIAAGGAVAALPKSALDNCWSALIQCGPEPSRFVFCGPIPTRACSWNDGCVSRWDGCPPESRFFDCGGLPPQTRLTLCSALDACPSSMQPCIPESEFCGPIRTLGCSVDDGCHTALGCGEFDRGRRVNPGRFNVRPRFRGF